MIRELKNDRRGYGHTVLWQMPRPHTRPPALRVKAQREASSSNISSSAVKAGMVGLAGLAVPAWMAVCAALGIALGAVALELSVAGIVKKPETVAGGAVAFLETSSSIQIPLRDRDLGVRTGPVAGLMASIRVLKALSGIWTGPILVGLLFFGALVEGFWRGVSGGVGGVATTDGALLEDANAGGKVRDEDHSSGHKRGI